MHEAALRKVPLTVVTVRPRPVRPATAVFWGLHQYAENDDDDVLTRNAVQELVDKVANETSATPSEVAIRVSSGNPAEELVNASRDADMLVVGSRGGGGFSSLMMGSVSSQVAHHAVCPVVVVPERLAP